MSRTRNRGPDRGGRGSAGARGPRRVRRIRPRPRVRPVLLAEGGVAAERLEGRPHARRRDARVPAAMDTDKDRPGHGNGCSSRRRRADRRLPERDTSAGERDARRLEPVSPSAQRGRGGPRLAPRRWHHRRAVSLGAGSVRDRHLHDLKASYREIACLVSGRGSSAVVVAAAPVVQWDRQAPTLERAVSSFVA